MSLHQELGYTDETVTKAQLTRGSHREAYLPMQSAFAECQFICVGNGPENDAQESARAELNLGEKWFNPEQPQGTLTRPLW